MVGRFVARCQRGHELIEFTDPTEFERHMTGTHKARKMTPGGAGYQGSLRFPSVDTPRPGGLPNRYLRPNRAPKDTVGLSKVLAAAATEFADHGYPVGWVHGVTDWHTDELVTLADVRTGDVFALGRHEYTVYDRDGWLIATPDMIEPKRPRNIEDRMAETVRIVKRAA